MRVETLCFSDMSVSASPPESECVHTSAMWNSPDRGSQTSLRNVAFLAPVVDIQH